MLIAERRLNFRKKKAVSKIFRQRMGPEGEMTGVGEGARGTGVWTQIFYAPPFLNFNRSRQSNYIGSFKKQSSSKAGMV